MGTYRGYNFLSPHIFKTILNVCIANNVNIAYCNDLKPVIYMSIPIGAIQLIINLHLLMRGIHFIYRPFKTSLPVITKH